MCWRCSAAGNRRQFANRRGCRASSDRLHAPKVRSRSRPTVPLALCPADHACAGRAGFSASKRTTYEIRVAAYNFEVGARCPIGLASTLLPIAKSSDRNFEPIGKILLRKPKLPSNSLDGRHPFHRAQLPGTERWIVWFALYSHRRTIRFVLFRLGDVELVGWPPTTWC